MAKSKTAEAPVDEFTVEQSEGIVRVREPKPNPLEAAVLATLEQGALKVPVKDEAQAKQAILYVRRAALKHNLGHSVQHRDGAVHFKATREKRQRKYTDTDVREWASAEGYGEEHLHPRIHADIRQAFKVANGFAKDETSADSGE